MYALLDDYMRPLVYVVLRESKECSQISRIYMREQLDPTSAFNRLYDGFIRDMRETLEALVAAILEVDAHSSEIKLIVETLIGQVAIFKSSRITVLHNMGWKNYGEERMADIERIVTFNVTCAYTGIPEEGVLAMKTNKKTGKAMISSKTGWEDIGASLCGAFR